MAVRFPGTLLFALVTTVPSSSCRSTPPPPAARPPGFEEDVAFLRQHAEVLVLSAPDSLARIAVVPAWQGRVATSTVGGAEGASYGWLNRELIAARRLQPHINAFGGEDRLWLGPEGGPFALFFAADAPFDVEHWQTPALIDTEPFPVVERSPARVLFRRAASLVNRAGTRFDLRIERSVRLLPRTAIEELLGTRLDELRCVGFETVNSLTNAGGEPWTKAGGMPSIWILGMFRPSDRTTVVLPYEGGAERGRIVNDDYFGAVPDARLAVHEGHVFFRGDGRERGKIGIGPRRAKPVLGSWDPERGVLTLVHFDLPVPPADDYVDSTWRHQEDPWSGDVVNSYNDGPLGPGLAPLGPFYELETSSPAADLTPGESLTHSQRTFHFEGLRGALDRLAHDVLGVGLDAIERALPEPVPREEPAGRD